jgi:Tfp pilus assembly protein PilO
VKALATSSKRMIAIGVIAGVIVTGLWFFVLYRPAAAGVQEVSAELDDEREVNDELEAELRRLKKLKENEPAIDRELATVNAAVPDTPQLADFIRKANDTAARTDLNWVQISPSEPQSAGPLSVINISMQGSGSYETVIEYLTQMAELDRAVTFDSYSITRAPDASGADRVNVKLEGRIFTWEAPVDAEKDN